VHHFAMIVLSFEGLHLFVKPPLSDKWYLLCTHDDVLRGIRIRVSQ